MIWWGACPWRSASRLARFWNFSIGSFSKLICEMLVGGMSLPQQSGQSGQPMPEPVTRTVAPTNMRNSTEMRAPSAIFCKRGKGMEKVCGENARSSNLRREESSTGSGGRRENLKRNAFRGFDLVENSLWLGV